MSAPTIREQALQALVELWRDPAPIEFAVHRNRARPIATDDLPAVAVSMGTATGGGTSERVERADHDDAVDRTLDVLAQVRTSGADVDLLHEQTDEIYAWIVTQVGTDPTLGGLVKDVREESSAFECEQRDVTYHALDVRFVVTFQTRESDPGLAPEED